MDGLPRLNLAQPATSSSPEPDAVAVVQLKAVLAAAEAEAAAQDGGYASSSSDFSSGGGGGEFRYSDPSQNVRSLSSSSVTVSSGLLQHDKLQAETMPKTADEIMEGTSESSVSVRRRFLSQVHIDHQPPPPPSTAPPPPNVGLPTLNLASAGLSAAPTEVVSASANASSPSVEHLRAVLAAAEAAAAAQSSDSYSSSSSSDDDDDDDRGDGNSECAADGVEGVGGGNSGGSKGGATSMLGSAMKLNLSSIRHEEIDDAKPEAVPLTPKEVVLAKLSQLSGEHAQSPHRQQHPGSAFGISCGPTSTAASSASNGANLRSTTLSCTPETVQVPSSTAPNPLSAAAPRQLLRQISAVPVDTTGDGIADSWAIDSNKVCSLESSFLGFPSYSRCPIFTDIMLPVRTTLSLSGFSRSLALACCRTRRMEFLTRL